MPDGLFPVQHLVYFYVGQSESKQPQRVLSPTDLLIPPLVVNQKPWTLGYFGRIFRAPLLPGDVLAAHCFRDFRGRYFSDAGEELKAATGPCGEWGLQSYLTVDDALSVALGFPPIPDDG
jgi:hypothetical protein